LVVVIVGAQGAKSKMKRTLSAWRDVLKPMFPHSFNARKRKEAQRVKRELRIDRLIDKVNDNLGVERLFPDETKLIIQGLKLLRSDT
jgi:ribonuclease PH